MNIFKTTGVAAGLIAAGTLIGASLSTLASIYDWSTSAGTNATADPNINWAEGMLPSAVNDSARATMAAIAAWRADTAAVPALGGAGNAFAITGTQPMQSWTPGLFSFKATRSNTGAVTFSRDSLAPKPLRVVSGADLVSGQIISGSIYLATYSTATDEVLMIGKLAISNSDFAPASALTVKANLTGGTANPSDVSLASFFAAAPSSSIPFASLASTGFSGEIKMMWSTTCPTGWIEANGTSSPDLRGQFVRGWDHGAGTDPGRGMFTAQADSLASHNHGVNDPGHHHSVGVNLAAGAGGASTNPVAYGTGTGSVVTSTDATGITIQATGGSETRPKNTTVLFCYHP